MPTQNFPRIPKIVLRKPCDDPKHAKTSTRVCLYIRNRWGTHQITYSEPPLISPTYVAPTKFWSFFEHL